MDHFGDRTTVAAGLAVCSLGMGLLVFAADGDLVLTILAGAVVGVGLAGLIAPASTVVMNDLPENKAGDGSSLNMVSRFVGAAVGVAVVVSIFASTYSSHMASSLRGGAGGSGPAGSLSPSQVATAEASISGALTLSRQLGSAAGTQLADAARAAFDSAATRGYLAVAALGLIGAVWAWRALRDAP